MASPETYQAAIRKLTAEGEQLRQANAAERAEYAQEVRALRAQLAEGLTPELLQLRRSVTEWRARAQAAEARLRRGGTSHGTR